MMDDAIPSSFQDSDRDFEGSSSSLRRALYLWERQTPSMSRPQQVRSVEDSQIAQRDDAASLSALLHPADDTSPSSDSAIDESLKRHAARLSALERIIPGDCRLDPPRFSLMMLNAFLGRAVIDGGVLARLPGLFSISDRIDGELTDLEFEYPDALQEQKAEPDPTPVLIRDEMRALLDGLKSQQKSQHRQIVSSLAALHTAINDLRAQLPERESGADHQNRSKSETDSPCTPSTTVDDLARPLIDPERLLDPRPVLAAARSAASRAHLELADQPEHEAQQKTSGSSEARPYKSVLLGSAVLGILMIIFGRDAVQFLSSASLNHGSVRP